MANEKTTASQSNKELTHPEKLSFAASEAYKLLRTNLQFSFPDNEKPCQMIGVTSSNRGEGKSTTSVNLAYTLAQSGKRVLLVDADMRLPTIHSKLGTRGAPGLSNILAGLAQQKDAFVVSDLFENKNLYILPAGDIPPNPSELLGSQKMKAMLESCSKAFNYIVVDLPPVNIVTDAMVVSQWLDGEVLVVRQNYTTASALASAMYQVEKIGNKFLGFVMTAADVSKTGNYKHYSRYGSRYYKKGYGYGNYGGNGGYGSGYGYGYGNSYGYGYGYGYGKSRSSGHDSDFIKATVEDEPAQFRDNEDQ